MKKSVLSIICSVVFVLIFFTSCDKSEGITDSDLLDNTSLNYITVDIPLLQKAEQQIICAAYGNFGNEHGKSQVMIVSDNTDEKSLVSRAYLAVMTENNKVLTYDFGEVEKIAVIEEMPKKIILKDLDGDSVDEIIVNFFTTGNRSSIAYILKLKNDYVELMFDLDREKYSFDETGKYVPRFFCEFLDDYKVKIYNDDIDFSEEVDISYFQKEFFDENGVGKSDTSWVSFDSVDKCGTIESTECLVFAESLIYLDSGAIGKIKMIYSYEAEKDSFVLHSAKLIEKTGEDRKTGDGSVS